MENTWKTFWKVVRFLAYPQGVIWLILSWSSQAHGQTVGIGIGFGGPGRPLQSGLITNLTNEYCELIARGKSFGKPLPPAGQMDLGSRKTKGPVHVMVAGGGYGGYAGSSNIEVPIVARCYADPQMQKFAEFKETKFQTLGEAISSTNVWNIGGDSTPFHALPTRQRAKLPFPSMARPNGHGIQIANASRYRLIIQLIGSNTSDVILRENGGVDYIEVSCCLNAPVISITATDPASGEFIGIWQMPTSGQIEGMSAENIILNNNSFSSRR